ncbi:MAG: FtsX-like permease family protein, partial [Candidatus Dadabacteria bacterium]
MAVMSGFEIELREKIIGANSHIVVKKLGGSIRNYKNLIKEIKQVDGVKSVSAFTYNQAMLRTKKSAAGVLVRGIEPESAAARQLLNYLPENSDIVSLLSPIPLPEDNKIELPPLVVGRELARAMFLVPGKAVSLLSPQVESSPFGLIPKFRRFIVSGTYSSGLVEYENTLVYTSLEAAQRFFKMEGAVSGLEVLVNDVEKAPIVSRAIMDKISGLQVGLYAQDWTETNKPLWDAIKLEKKAYFIILLLIVVMASFSIVSTLVMIVLEKRRDIAVLMTMGANSRNIADIFKFQGAIIGAIGTVLGLLFGFFGCLA